MNLCNRQAFDNPLLLVQWSRPDPVRYLPPHLDIATTASRDSRDSDKLHYSYSLASFEMSTALWFHFESQCLQDFIMSATPFTLLLSPLLSHELLSLETRSAALIRAQHTFVTAI